MSRVGCARKWLGAATCTTKIARWIRLSRENTVPKWHYHDLRRRHHYVAFISRAWSFIDVINYVWNDIIIDPPKDIA